MAKNAQNVRVALTGSVWYEPNLNAAILTDLSGPPTATAEDLGFTTADGVTFKIAKETTDIGGWQTMNPLRRLVTSEPRSASFTLRQLDRTTWLRSMGGTITELVAGNPATYRWEPNDGQVVEGMLFIDFVDGSITYRFGFRRAAQSAEVEFSLVRGDAVNVPNEWTALAPTAGKAFHLDTNDPAFAPTSGVPLIGAALPLLQTVGDPLVLTGARFTGTTGITIDGQAVAAGKWDVINDGQIALVIPAAVAGAAPIIVTNASGASAAFNYTAV